MIQIRTEPPPTLHLPQRYLKMTQALLQYHLPDAEVWAYGSRVNGQGHEASDLDLVVRNPAQITAETANLSLLKAAFTESALPIRVDIVDWARIPESFRREIEQRYVVIKPVG
ncbi:MAG: nucleotidyltransferase domain-containing protein [Magnetococcales bacterium]|nr:nucleotidyltransferase domain-containing protein [Magnetococcales bacterium]